MDATTSALRDILVDLAAQRRAGRVDHNSAVFFEAAVWDAARKAGVYDALGRALRG